MDEHLDIDNRLGDGQSKLSAGRRGHLLAIHRNRDDYDVLLFVSNWPEPRTPAWTALLKARAIENQCYVIGVNRSGKDPRGLQYAGGSAVYDPLGETVLDLGAVEGSGSVTIEITKVEAIRSQLPFLQDADEFELSLGQPSP